MRSTLALITLAPFLMIACEAPPKTAPMDQSIKPAEEKAAPAQEELAGSSLSKADQKAVVARINGAEITLGEFERRLNDQPPFARARYNTPDRKKDFLNNMVQFEVLAEAAASKGFDKDPEVALQMKQAMVRKLMAAEIEAKMGAIEIPEAEKRAFYQAQIKDYIRPEQVRISQIVLADKATALKTIQELKASFEKDKTHKRRIFALKAREVSIDKPTAQKGGDMNFTARAEEGGTVPKIITDAAFAMEFVSNMTDEPIQSEKGWHIVMLTARKQRFERTFEDVERNIHNRLLRERRSEIERTFIEDTKKAAKIEVNEDLLGRIKDPEPPKGQPKAGHGHGDKHDAPPKEGLP